MPKPTLTRKKIFIISGAVGLLVLGSIGIAVWVRQSSDKDEPTTPVSVEDVQIAALEYANTKDIDKGLEYYDEQIDKRQDANEKKQLLLSKSSFARDAERSDIALDAAKQADVISSDLGTIAALAAAYEAAGDREQALAYYEKALEISPKEGMESRDNYLWELKIEELKQ